MSSRPGYVGVPACAGWPAAFRFAFSPGRSIVVSFVQRGMHGGSLTLGFGARDQAAEWMHMRFLYTRDLMASRALDAEIDRLYQLPLEEFTAARNALAKGAGAEAARIRALSKPPIAAWAVNQLYWKNPDIWSAVVAAGENAQKAHRAVLAGRSADVRAASKVHEDAVEKALRATVALLKSVAHEAADATKHAIGTTLRALPGDETPGRFTRTLQPAGFGMLTGLAIAAGPARAHQPTLVKAAAAPARPSQPKVDVKALTRARQAAAEAARVLRDTENALRRDEFEQVRTEREEKRAAEAAEKATALREAAAERVEESRRALSTARSRAAAATDAVKAIEKGRPISGR